MNAHVTRSIIEHSKNGSKVIEVDYPKNSDRIDSLIKAIGFSEAYLLPTPEVGPTGYLEVSGDEPEGYGTDSYGRKFVQFKVQKSTHDREWNDELVRVFQRYPNSDVLVTCETGPDFISSAMKPKQLADIISMFTESKMIQNTTLEEVYWFEVEKEGISAEEAFAKDPRIFEITCVYMRLC